MSVEDTLIRVWDEIKTGANVLPESVDVAKQQILSQDERQRDMYAYEQASAHAQLGDLANVLAWIDAEEKLPEEKLYRAKGLLDIVNRVNIRQSHEIGTLPGTASVLGRITGALEELARERNK